MLFEGLDREEWSQKLGESRDAYTALRDHFLKYIEHPDDLESTVDPLADDEEVGGSLDCAPLRKYQRDGYLTDFCSSIVSMANPSQRREFTGRNLSGRRPMLAREFFLSGTNNKIHIDRRLVCVLETQPRCRLQTRHA